VLSQKLVDPAKVEQIIRDVAVEYILPRYQTLRSEDIREKNGPRDLVTIADVESEHALTQRLTALLPGSVVVGEEGYAADPSILTRISGDQPVWIIDPVDGTWSFAHGKKHFGVIVALVHRGETIAGWIHHPLANETMVTEQGSGTWFRGQQLKTRPPDSLGNMIGLTGMMVDKWLKQLPPEQVLVKTASMPRPACFDYVRLLTPESFLGDEQPQAHYRVIARRSKPWDDAAGALAYTEAGGYVANWEGQIYRPHMILVGVIAAPDKRSWEETYCYFNKLKQKLELQP
jgi:fructose-1,6-bisphosphatase/inositol monophosphatase family enzyme